MSVLYVHYAAQETFLAQLTTLHIPCPTDHTSHHKNATPIYITVFISILNFVVDSTHFISFMVLVPPDTHLVPMFRMSAAVPLAHPPTRRHGADHLPPTVVPTDLLAGDLTRPKHFTAEKRE